MFKFKKKKDVTAMSERHNFLSEVTDAKVTELIAQLEETDPSSEEYLYLMEQINDIEQYAIDHGELENPVQEKIVYKIDWAPVWGFLGTAVTVAGTIATVKYATAAEDEGRYLTNVGKSLVNKGIGK